MKQTTSSKLRHVLGRALTVTVGALGSVLVLGAAPATAEQITITIERVRALDRIDPAGQADFMARVTIDGEVFTTKRERRHDDLIPTNWVFSKSVGRGTYPVKIEIYDKDILTRSDLVDINRVAPKRDLDFNVPTYSTRCRLSDFSGSPRCGETITREGTEKRKARLSFRVDVTR